MRWLVAGLVAVALGGCLDEPAAPPGPTGQIDGAVLNHVLVPYANATVHMPDLERTTSTTSLGGFSFFDVPVGFHTLEVRLADGIDREVVLVEEDHITRVILQVLPVPVDKPHVTALSDTQIVQMAMPGEDCEECSWRATLKERRPDAIEFLVAWDGHHPAVATMETHLIVQLEDQDGTVIIGPLGRQQVSQQGDLFVLCAAVDGVVVPESAGTLQLEYRFDPDNPLPHPDFQMESHMRLHYGDDDMWC